MRVARLFSKTSVGYTLSTVFVQGMTFICGVVIARLVRPAEYGLWLTFMLILRYMSNINFGTLNAMNREVPYYNGKKDFKEAKKIVNVAFTSCVLFAGIAAVALLIMTFLPWFNFTVELASGLRILAPLVILQQIFLYFQIYYRGNQRFDLLAILEPLFAFFSTVLMIFFILKYRDINYLLIALAISYAIVLGYNQLKNNFVPGFEFEIAKVFSLIKIGFPILLSGFIGTFFYTSERLIILKFLDSEQLGLYGIAIMAATALQLLPSVIFVMTYPRFAGLFGASGGNVLKLKDPLVQLTSLIAFFVSISLSFVYFFIPSFVGIFLPAYHNGILAAQILSIGIFFYIITGISGIFLTTINRQLQYVLFLSLGFLLNILINTRLVKAGLGISGVALGTSLSYLIYAVIVLSSSFRNFDKKISSMLGFFRMIASPFLFCLSGVILIERLFGLFIPSAGQDPGFMTAGIKALIFTLWLIPLSMLRFKDKSFSEEVSQLKSSFLYSV